jgi:arylsulfatase A-like enzyme
LRPAASHGIYLDATLARSTTPARRSLHFAYRDVQRAVRDERWKLICYQQVDRTRLFDLQIGLHERTNLADRPEHAAQRSAMTALLEQKITQSGDIRQQKAARYKETNPIVVRMRTKPG